MFHNSHHSPLPPSHFVLPFLWSLFVSMTSNLQTPIAVKMSIFSFLPFRLYVRKMFYGLCSLSRDQHGKIHTDLNETSSLYLLFLL